MSGTVNISRDLFEHGVFKDEPLSAREALIWLAMRGRIIHVTLPDISRAWKVPERRAVQIVKQLERRGFIAIFGGGMVRCIFIITDRIEACGLHKTQNAKGNPRIGGGKWRVASLSKKTTQRILARDGSCCAYCGSEAGPFHIDHIKPVCKGGQDHDLNLTVACWQCNLSKGGKTLSDWKGRK